MLKHTLTKPYDESMAAGKVETMMGKVSIAGGSRITPPPDVTNANCALVFKPRKSRSRKGSRIFF